MIGRKQGQADARYEAGVAMIDLRSRLTISFFLRPDQSLGSKKRVQNAIGLYLEPGLRMPGWAASVEKYSLDQLRIQFAAGGGLQRVARGILATFDVRADTDAVHGPVERSQTF